MRRLMLACAALFAASLCSPLTAQDHSSHGSDPKPATAPKVDHCAMGHLPPEQCPPKNHNGDHGGMGHSPTDHVATDNSGLEVGDQPVHSGQGEMDHSQHGAATDKSAPGAASQSAVPTRAFAGPRHAADAIWGGEAMAPIREKLARENGGMRTSSVLIERLEARLAADGGEDGYVWDAQAFYGGDINRFVLKTEGEGAFGGELEDAEIQALYSRAIGPFFDLQAGVRFDPEPDARGHLVIGVQGLAPYMLHVDGALFLSDRGDLTARFEGEYDQRITQRLIIQPRLEVELAAQDIPERGIGAGITKIEPGLRMRYEIEREFAPYIGIEYEAALGETADIARAAGEDPDGAKILVGLRTWF